MSNLRPTFSSPPPNSPQPSLMGSGGGGDLLYFLEVAIVYLSLAARRSKDPALAGLIRRLRDEFVGIAISAYEHTSRIELSLRSFRGELVVSVDLFGRNGMNYRVHLFADLLPRDARPAVASHLVNLAGRPSTIVRQKRPGGLARFARPDHRFTLADALAVALEATDEGLQICRRDSVIARLREIKAQLLSLATVIDSARPVAAYRVDRQPICVLEITGSFQGYRGHIEWSELEPQAAWILVRLVG